MSRLGLVELAQMGPVTRGFGVHAERLQAAALLQYLGAEANTACFDVRLAFEDDVQFLGTRGHLVEPGPAHRIVPLPADGLIAIVHRSGRCVLAFERIAGVEAP